MTEDPLERIEREEREKKNRNGGLKTATIILAVAALALAGALAWIWGQKSNLVNELEGEKAELTQQLLNLQNDFEGLSSDYESINSQLDTSREQVALLIDKLSKTEATNRAKIRQYEKELGTLRSIMRGYIVQIDSLNTLNKQLTADAAAARREAAESRQANENLTRQVENLSGQVAAGSVVKARGLRLAAYNGSDRETDRSSRVTYFVSTLSLVENQIAERGPIRVYVRVKDPNGVLLLNNSSSDFTVGGETLTASASREVDYEGQDVELSIYIKDVGELGKGIYTVEAYTEKAFLGRSELMLR
jgi:Membrane-bound metallopeptidase